MAEGDTLWAWQSQEPDGRWSLIAMFGTTDPELAMFGTPEEIIARAGEMQVLVHRKRRVIEAQRHHALSHHRRFGQPIRLARFNLGGVAETIE